MPKTIKLYFVEKLSEGDTDKQLEAMRNYFKFTDLKDCQAIFCASIDSMQRASVAKINSGKPLIVYCWDYYLFAHNGTHTGWDWKRYAEFLKQADRVLVPSTAQQLRLKELLDLDSYVVKSGILTYEHEVSDENFILDPMRYYPYEECHWAERCAKELAIPIIHSEHQYNEEEFKKLIATCSFMTCGSPEASTGGLSLGEGLWLGKKSLVNNSPYNGAKDYLGEYAEYFNNYDELKIKMKDMWENRKTVNGRDYMTKELSFDTMAKGIYNNICELVKNF